MTEDEWQWSEPESVSPADPIVHGARWREALERIARGHLLPGDMIDTAREALRLGERQ